MPNRVSFLIDGLNLYHSIRRAMADTKCPAGRWLDIARLCQSYLYLYGRDATLADVYYFSALAGHLSVQTQMKHKALITALETTGVKVVLGQFKKKEILCRASCRQSGWGYEEKETDVNIAITLLELFVTDACDTAVIVSGDTDLATAVRAAKRLFPGKKVGVGFPYKRFNHELKQLAHHSFTMSAHQYSKFTFPTEVVRADGSKILKPQTW